MTSDGRCDTHSGVRRAVGATTPGTHINGSGSGCDDPRDLYKEIRQWVVAGVGGGEDQTRSFIGKSVENLCHKSLHATVCVCARVLLEI